MYPDLVVVLYRSQEHLLDERLEHRRTRIERQGLRRPERWLHVRALRSPAGRR